MSNFFDELLSKYDRFVYRVETCRGRINTGSDSLIGVWRGKEYPKLEQSQNKLSDGGEGFRD